MVVRKQVFDEVGGFDEALAVAYNDVDFCLRLRARGLRNVWTPFAELYHFEGVSRGRDDTAFEVRPGFLAETQLMKDRWGDLLNEDPYFNLNLLPPARGLSDSAIRRGTVRRWWET